MCSATFHANLCTVTTNRPSICVFRTRLTTSSDFCPPQHAITGPSNGTTPYSCKERTEFLNMTYTTASLFSHDKKTIGTCTIPIAVISQ